jgi:3-oxoadipate enol-lactonase
MTSATNASNQAPTTVSIKNVSRSGTIRTNGQELYYEIHGAGPPLVLVMGSDTTRRWGPSNKSPSCPPGSRSSSWTTVMLAAAPEPITPTPSPTWPDDVAGLLDALDIHRTHLLGLSMGAMIGIEFALRHADRLDRLVLAGPAAAPARSAVDPIFVWNWVKANDPTGEVFGT